MALRNSRPSSLERLAEQLVDRATVAGESLTAAELAREVGVHRATAASILRQLTARNSAHNDH